MKIQLKDDATCGKVAIPRGEYAVALQTDGQRFDLLAGGRTIQIPAIKRRATSKTRTTTVMFYSGGGNSWSLVVNTPKHGEFVAYIEYVRSHDRD